MMNKKNKHLCVGLLALAVAYMFLSCGGRGNAVDNYLSDLEKKVVQIEKIVDDYSAGRSSREETYKKSMQFVREMEELKKKYNFTAEMSDLTEKQKTRLNEIMQRAMRVNFVLDNSY